MPDNTFLFLGLGLAFLLFRNNGGQSENGELVDASMLSQGTGTTGKALNGIPVVTSDASIGSNGAAPTANGFDINAWLQNLTAEWRGKMPPAVKKSAPIVNEDLPNVEVGPEPEVSVSPFIQTPEYIRTTGELAGTAVRQLGLQRGVDVLNDRIYIQEIAVDGGEGIQRMEGPLYGDENVQIVAGGANPGDPYYTTLDFLVAAKDQGYFGTPLSGPEASARSNVFDVAANEAYLRSIAPIEEQLTVTGGVPLSVDDTNLETDWWLHTKNLTEWENWQATDWYGEG